MSRSTTTVPSNHDVNIMMWALAVLVAFILLFGIVTLTPLSDLGIAGWMAGLSTGLRLAMSAFFNS